jgi:hypothetical protein
VISDRGRPSYGPGGYVSYYRGEHREAIRAMREARPVAVEAGDRYAEADTFLIEAMAASLAASPEDAGRLAGEVVRLGRSIGSPRIAGWAWPPAPAPASVRGTRRGPAGSCPRPAGR